MSENDIIEPEIEDASSEGLLMRTPFDPALISIETKTPSLSTLIDRIDYGEIELNTNTYFQRSDNLWDAETQSRLIESILVSFPLPAFYFDGSDKKRWLVVDGLQRLSSIRNFVVNQTLRLKGMEFLTHLEGLKYYELHRDLQRIIKEATIVTHVITANTPTNVKFNIFKRINTGGVPLNGQEIRHALFQGIPANFVAELAQEDVFHEATNKAFEKDNRMLDREFVNRFLCFYMFGVEKYDGDFDSYLNKAMANLNELSQTEREAIKLNFIASMQLNKDIFGTKAFRKIDVETQVRSRTPINKALFDVLSVQFALLNSGERAQLKDKKDIFKQKFYGLIKERDDFFTSISSATDYKKRVTYRHNAIKNLIQQVINQ